MRRELNTISTTFACIVFQIYFIYIYIYIYIYRAYVIIIATLNDTFDCE